MTAMCCLYQVPDEVRLDRAAINFGEPESMLFGTMHRVRVSPITHEPKKEVTQLYYGKTAHLEWDLERLAWPGNMQFTMYTSKLVRQWLAGRHVIPDVVENKWRGILPQGFRLRWSTIWDSQRIRKEAGLLWRMWHRAVEVNAWRGAINATINQDCMVCQVGARETVLHCFWECKAAKEAWSWGLRIIRALADGPGRHRRWAPLNWKQSIFSYRVPRRFRDVGRFWTLLRTTILWTIWLQRNDLVFSGIQWHLAKVKQRIWQCMIDYGRVAWSVTVKKMEKDSQLKHILLQDFKALWCKHEVFATLVDSKPRWVLLGSLV